jgi:ribonuclease HII
MQTLKKEGKLNFSVALVSNKTIDEKGISYAIREGIKGVLKKLDLEAKYCKVFLDGSLKAPAEFTNQETIIKGDEKIPVISLASIAAKVTRDRYMKKAAEDYIGYGFEIHKGYGTKTHIECIRKQGFSAIHRRSFAISL